MAIDFTNVMKHKTDYLTYEEIDMMLQHAFDSGKIRNYMLILTLYRTGRRISEILGMKPYNVYVGLRPIDIHPDGLIEFDIVKKNHIKTKTKLGKDRSEEAIERDIINKKPKRVLLPVDREYLELLNNYIHSENISDYNRIFAITRQRAWQIIVKIAKDCNIKRSHGKIHPHQFRHSFAIHLIKSHPNDAAVIRQVQELLQHSDIRITMESYGKFTQEDKRDMLERTFRQEKQ